MVSFDRCENSIEFSSSEFKLIDMTKSLGVTLSITVSIPTFREIDTDMIIITMVERMQMFAIPTAFCFILKSIPDMVVKLFFL